MNTLRVNDDKTAAGRSEEGLPAEKGIPCLSSTLFFPSCMRVRGVACSTEWNVTVSLTIRRAISFSQPQLCMAPVWGQHPISEVALVPHDFLAVQSSSGGGQSAGCKNERAK